MTNHSLKITLIQSVLDWENAEINLQTFSSIIENLKEETDLIILPEMFSTGFTMNSETLAEPMNGKSVDTMLKWASQKNCAVCGSLIIRENGHIYNRFVWAEPNGKIFHYDKRHLFALAGENEHYSRGEKNIIIHYKGFKILPQICYDLRFPVWCRRTPNQDYDLLIFISNWPEKRSYAWETLLKARAIENQSFVASVNRVGIDGNHILYSGNSMIINPLGKEILGFKDFEEGVITAEISLNELNQIRSQLPFFVDGDAFEIQ